MHVCILTHLLHKNLLHLCTRFVAPCPFCTKGPCLHQKPLRCLFLSEVFASSRPSVGVRFNFALFAPQHAAKQPNIAVNPSFSIHTATHSAQLKQTRLLCVCVCVLYQDSSTQLQALRLERGAAVVNCESKTVNRIWSTKRSGAWCMDWRRAAKTH